MINHDNFIKAINTYMMNGLLFKDITSGIEMQGSCRNKIQGNINILRSGVYLSVRQRKGQLKSHVKYADLKRKPS